jgi:hypothetical protein
MNPGQVAGLDVAWGVWMTPRTSPAACAALSAELSCTAYDHMPSSVARPTSGTLVCVRICACSSVI